MWHYFQKFEELTVQHKISQNMILQNFNCPYFALFWSFAYLHFTHLTIAHEHVCQLVTLLSHVHVVGQLLHCSLQHLRQPSAVLGEIIWGGNYASYFHICN